MRHVAHEVFGISKLRKGQSPIIRAVLEGKDVVGVLPTGAGKSLCFQIPALLKEGVTVVVSPLLSLIEDQTQKLDAHGVPVTKLDSTLTAAEEEAAHSAIGRGDRILYVTPERLERPEVIELLRKSGVALVVVDEAHCVSQWGHDFRPAYLSIRDAVTPLGRPPVLALTATATPELTSDIVRQLGMAEPIIVRTEAERPNLFFEVRRTPSEDGKMAALVELLREAAAKRESAIVYTATVAAAEALHESLVSGGLDVTIYHGRLGKSARLANQNAFMSGESPIVVATSAFGLGIDKPDVRLVVHHMFPDSLETYYQEAGRAGRDGQPARALLLYRLEDRRVRAYFLGGKYPKRQDLLAIYEAIATSQSPASTVAEIANAASVSARRTKTVVAQLESMGVLRRRPGGRVELVRKFVDHEELAAYAGSYEERATSDKDKLDDMMHYAQMPTCRVRGILEYFGEEPERDCGHCDNCRDHTVAKLAARELPEPETSPVSEAIADEPSFDVGDVVVHAAFGRGKVEAVTSEHVRVRFARGEIKTIAPDHLATR